MLEIIVKYTGAVYGFVHRETRNIPTTEDKVVGMHHREDVRGRNMDFFSSARLGADIHSRSTENGTNVVGLLNAILGVQRDIVPVGKDSSAQSGAVASHTDQHQPVLNLIRGACGEIKERNIPSLANLASGLELKRLCGGGDRELAINHDDISTAVRVLGGDVVVSVDGVLGLDGDIVGMTSSGWMNWNDGLQLRKRYVVAGRVRGCHWDIWEQRKERRD